MDHPADTIVHTTNEALAEMRNSSMSPPYGIDLTTYHTMSGHCILYHRSTSCSPSFNKVKYVIVMPSTIKTPSDTEDQECNVIFVSV